MVEINLYNGGEDAYQPELYGDTITVARVATASGSGGGYKLKSSSGRVVSAKKADLDRMMSAFGIEVDNPIAVLNQDAAKSFLYKCDPEKLYQFFMRATQLEEVKDEYNQAGEEKETADILLKRRLAEIPDLLKDQDRCNKRLQAHQSVRTRKKKIDAKKAELAWAMAAVAEDAVHKIETEQVKWANKIAAAEEMTQKENDEQAKLKEERKEVAKDRDEVKGLTLAHWSLS